MSCTLILLVCNILALGFWGRPLQAQPAVQLSVQPASLELVGPGARHGVLITATDPNGVQRDVTGQATITPSKTGVAALVGSLIQAQGDGTTELVVKYQGAEVRVPVTVSQSQAVEAPSFVNEVTPLLTRMGCNQGSCHGKGSGQNGFRLSLRGYAPEWDHTWLTREFASRRVNTAHPEASLLLQKPLGQAPHEGGKLLNVGSREHQLLLSWLQAGAPGPHKNERTLQQLELLPGNRRMVPGTEQQLLVRARFSDGRWQDVTWLTQFVTNDAGVATVSPSGRVRMLRPGETAVRATFLGQVAVLLVTAPHNQNVKPALLAKRNNVIDEHVFQKLADLRIEPADLCGDATFLRRAFLDTIGLLPTSEEVRAFLADQRADKRSRWIDALLERPEFVDFWTLQMADLFQNRKESDHDVRGTKGVRAFHEWLRKQVAANRPWDELARAVLTAKGTTHENPAVGYYIVTVGEHRQAAESTVVASVAQTFLGTRIGCAQCHNHPLERYTQDDYYHFAGYFSRIKLERKDPKMGPTKLVVSAPDANQNKQPVGFVQPRTGKFLVPQPLDRSTTPVQPSDDPREVLAKWMTSPENTLFSGAMVNRLWAHFLGTGLVEPIDDQRASNPPTNPALWKALIKEFVQSKFDRKHLVRLILNSRTYQLSAATTPGNEKDSRFYSHYYVRRLPAEVLADALSRSTGVPDAFPGYPVGLRAVQLPDPSAKSYFLTLFGKSERITACACERNGEVTMPQLLHLQNGSSVIQKIASGEGQLQALLRAKKSDDDVVEELFLTTLSRQPTADEWQTVRAALNSGDPRAVVLRDLFWALLNTKEFAFNH